MFKIDPLAYLRIISHEDRSLRATAVRTILLPAEFAYTAAMRVRNLAYDLNCFKTVRLDIPVISVGNLTLGGTGKTPLVAWLARFFRQHNVRVTIISRGYGAASASRNDEAKALESLLPDVPHLQNPDRLAAAQVAIQELAAQLIILDDAFQHRRLARDLDIVLVDALSPFGFGHVFPRGLLREPLSGIRRAEVVVLSRADLVDQEVRDEIRATIQRLAPLADWAEVRHAPTVLVSAAGNHLDLETLQGTRVAAFCGIGNPEGFRRTLKQLNYDLVDFRVFPDHHPYTRQDVHTLREWLEQSKAQVAICTEKDLVKIGLDRLGNTPLWALRVEINFLSGQEAIENRLGTILERIRERPDPLFSA
jgi:tetraacyldisaccharide 4'-kinase